MSWRAWARANDAAQETRGFCCFVAGEIFDFDLQVLRHQFAQDDRLVEEPRGDHAFAQVRRQGSGAVTTRTALSRGMTTSGVRGAAAATASLTSTGTTKTSCPPRPATWPHNATGRASCSLSSSRRRQPALPCGSSQARRPVISFPAPLRPANRQGDSRPFFLGQRPESLAQFDRGGLRPIPLARQDVSRRDGLRVSGRCGRLWPVFVPSSLVQ